MSGRRPPASNSASQWGKYGSARTTLTAFGLGIAVGLGFALAKFSVSLVDFGLYLMAVSLFHLWEYTYVCIYHPSDVSVDSFMVNHSNAFNIALALSFVEYFLEWYRFPWLKSNFLVYAFGFILVVGGQLLRTVAMMTAGENFSHYIAEEKKPEHSLVTFGVYSVVRHPSYTGWFIWSIATQIILANPICICAYAYASWIFFKKRIAYEESTLTSHFGDSYKRYQRDVPSDYIRHNLEIHSCVVCNICIIYMAVEKYKII